MEWIDINERRPTQADLINGRVPILDDDGYIGWALFLFNGDRVSPISDYKVAYWLEGLPASPILSEPPEWMMD